MLDFIKVVIMGIVEGITEWLPVSSTGHLILVGSVLKPGLSDAFMEMFDVVIQLGAIMAVVVLYFHKLNPFSPRKSERQKMLTWQMWIKVAIASVPAAIVGLLFNDYLDAIFYKPVPVAIMLIVYGVLFIIIEDKHRGKQDFTAYTEDAVVDRRVPDACIDSGNFKIRCDNRRSAADRSIQRDSSGIYIFPCDSGYVRSKPPEAVEIWICIFSSRVRFPDAWVYCIIWCIYICYQVSYGIY